MTFDPAPYIRHYVEENERTARQLKLRLEVAVREAERLAQKLKSLTGVRAIWFFGSAARGDPHELEFDLDLAMDGGDLYAGLDLVAESEFSVDLVSLSQLPERFREQIASQGRRL